MKRVALVLLILGFGCAVPSVPIDGSTGTGGAASSTTSSGSTSGTGGSGGATPVGPWINSTANLAGMNSVCGTLRWMSAKPDEDMLIAGVAQKGLWSSVDGGASWHALGTGAGSATVDNRIAAIVYDPKNPARFWEAGIYDGHGVFETKNNGATFAQLGTVTHVDLVSVDFTDPARNLLIAGGHEQDQTLHRSSDGGMTWTEIGSFLPAGRGCTFPLVIDATTHLVGCGAPFGGGGILRTIDGGMTWTEVSKSGGASAPLQASDGTIYWASPVAQTMIRSADGGKTWTESPTTDVGYSSPIELPDGRIAALNSQYVMVSSDRATSWSRLVTLPYQDAFGLVYSAQRKAIYVWRSDCGADVVPVAPNAIMRYDFDYATK